MDTTSSLCAWAKPEISNRHIYKGREAGKTAEAWEKHIPEQSSQLDSTSLSTVAGKGTGAKTTSVKPYIYIFIGEVIFTANDLSRIVTNELFGRLYICVFSRKVKLATFTLGRSCALWQCHFSNTVIKWCNWILRIQKIMNSTKSLCIYNVLARLNIRRRIRRIESKNWYLLGKKEERMQERFAEKHVPHQRTPCARKGWCTAKPTLLLLCVWQLQGVTIAVRCNYTSIKNCPERFMGVVLQDHHQIP